MKNSNPTRTGFIKTGRNSDSCQRNIPKEFLFNILFLQLQKSNPTLQAPAGHGMVFKEILLKVIREGQSSGEFNNDIPPEIILELIHGILWSSLNGANQGNDLTNNTRLKLDLLLHGILNKKG